MNAHNLQYNQFICRIWLFVHVKDEKSNITSEKDKGQRKKKGKKMVLEGYFF